MRQMGPPVISVIAIALWLAAASIAEAQKPMRIGASVSRTGVYAEIGPTVYRGQSLCVKQANEAGGVHGRKIELLVEDDQSEADQAAAIYERLIGQERVEAVFAPYSSTLTEAVAAVTEKHRIPLVSCCGSSTSIFKKGRRFVFMLQTPAEVYFEGLIEIAAGRGLKTIAVLHEDTLFPTAVAQGTLRLAKKWGLQPVVVEAYPRKTTDFSPALTRVTAATPDIAAATYFDDSVAITRRMKSLEVSPKMYGLTIGVDLPKFYEMLGSLAEFTYGRPSGTPPWSRCARGAWYQWRASTPAPGSSWRRTARSSRGPTCRIRPLRGTRRVRFSLRP